jgi:hypothetical protein
MLFYALHGATYPIQRLAPLLQQDNAEFMNLTGLFTPDAIRFAMYVVAGFVLIKYARLLAWLLCRDLLDNKTSPDLLEATSARRGQS